MATFEIRIGDRVHPVERGEEGEVSIEGRTFTTEPLGDGRYRVSEGARQWIVTVAGPRDERWVACDGRVARVELAEMGTARRRAQPQHDAMSAPMPATVVKLLVQPGQHVSRGETVLVLDAMKMELPIRSPRDGVVREVACAAGDLVQSGVTLVTLE